MVIYDRPWICNHHYGMRAFENEGTELPKKGRLSLGLMFFDACPGCPVFRQTHMTLVISPWSGIYNIYIYTYVYIYILYIYIYICKGLKDGYIPIWQAERHPEVGGVAHGFLNVLLNTQLIVGGIHCNSGEAIAVLGNRCFPLHAPDSLTSWLPQAWKAMNRNWAAQNTIADGLSWGVTNYSFFGGMIPSL